MTPHGPTCPICSAPVPPPFRAPPPEASPDLDMRPGEPTRSTLHHWMATCATCGAAAPDLADLPPSARGIVESADYPAIADSAPRYALPFLRWAAICRAVGRTATAAEAMLMAAWAADDEADDAHATAWRLEAAELWNQQPPTDAVQLVLVDVLRRAGAFARAAAACETLRAQTQDENTLLVLAFQAARIAAGDRGRHLMGSALRPPARTPHLAHAPKPAKGLLAACRSQQFCG